MMSGCAPSHFIGPSVLRAKLIRNYSPILKEGLFILSLNNLVETLSTFIIRYFKLKFNNSFITSGTYLLKFFYKSLVLYVRLSLSYTSLLSKTLWL